MVDLERLRPMVDNAPVTLLALPKWDIVPHHPWKLSGMPGGA